MGILSTLMKSVIPEPYAILARIAVVVLVLLGAFTTGWVKRGAHDQLAQDNQIIKDQVKIIHIKDTQTVVDNTAVSALQKQVSTLRTTNSKLQKQIATANNLTVVVNGSCVLSRQWLDIYNASVESP